MAKILKIALSEGHGKYTAGKRSPNGEREWYFNNLMGKGFREEIKNYAGVQVRLVSDASGERDVPLQERTDISNSWGADVYVSLHHNAYQGKWGNHTGTETYIYNRDWYRSWKTANKERERVLAKVANDAIVKVYKLVNRGVKEANFHEVREPRADAILVEGGYMDSSIDIKVMRKDSVVKESGRQLARDIAKHYKLERLGGNAVGKEDVGTIYRVQVGAFSKVGNAAAFAKEVEDKTGFGTYLVDTNTVSRVQVGAFADKKNAENRLKELQRFYKDAFITTNGTNAIDVAEPQNEPAAPVAPKQKSVNELVKEVLAGKHGNGDARKKSLGSRYDEVQAVINKTSTPKAPAKTTAQLVAEVHAGLHGNGEARKKSLGSRYDEVQAAINKGSVGSSTKNPTLKKGSRVKLKGSATNYATGERIPSSIKNKAYTIQQVGKDRVLLQEILSWVFTKDVQ